MTGFYEGLWCLIDTYPVLFVLGYIVFVFVGGKLLYPFLYREVFGVWPWQNPK